MKKNEGYMVNTSKVKNCSGYFRVQIVKNNKLKQGYEYRYRWYEGGKKDGKRKTIGRVNLDDLEKEVKKRGLPWIKLD